MKKSDPWSMWGRRYEAIFVDGGDTTKSAICLTAWTMEHNFQYIVSLNTDDIPAEVPLGFSIEDYALDVRLRDSTEDGGLFGFRFE